MKKLIFILSIILSAGICYAGETLTAQQKEAREWLKKGMNHQ